MSLENFPEDWKSNQNFHRYKNFLKFEYYIIFKLSLTTTQTNKNMHEDKNTHTHTTAVAYFLTIINNSMGIAMKLLTV